MVGLVLDSEPVSPDSEWRRVFRLVATSQLVCSMMRWALRQSHFSHGDGYKPRWCGGAESPDPHREDVDTLRRTRPAQVQEPGRPAWTPPGEDRHARVSERLFREWQFIVSEGGPNDRVTARRTPTVRPLYKTGTRVRSARPTDDRSSEIISPSANTHEIDVHSTPRSLDQRS